MPTLLRRARSGSALSPPSWRMAAWRSKEHSLRRPSPTCCVRPARGHDSIEAGPHRLRPSLPGRRLRSAPCPSSSMTLPRVTRTSRTSGNSRLTRSYRCWCSRRNRWCWTSRYSGLTRFTWCWCSWCSGYSRLTRYSR